MPCGGVPVCAAPGFLIILISLALAKIGIIKKCQKNNSSVSDPIDCLGEAFYWLSNLIPAKSTQKFLIKNMIPMFYHLAKSDGHISKEEINNIDKWMREDLSLNLSEREKAIKLFKSSRQSEREYLIFAKKINEGMKRSPVMLREAIEALLKVASADGIITEAEKSLIHKTAGIFGISDSKFRSLLSPYTSKGTSLDYKIDKEIKFRKASKTSGRTR